MPQTGRQKSGGRTEIRVEIVMQLQRLIATCCLKIKIITIKYEYEATLSTLLQEKNI